MSHSDSFAFRNKVAQRLKNMPWSEFVSLLSDDEVRRITLWRTHYSEQKKQPRESVEVYKRRWLIEDGQGSFKFPEVPFTIEERKKVTWQGKTKFSAEEHRNADRIRTRLSSSQKRAKSVCTRVICCNCVTDSLPVLFQD